MPIRGGEEQTASTCPAVGGFSLRRKRAGVVVLGLGGRRAGRRPGIASRQQSDRQPSSGARRSWDLHLAATTPVDRVNTITRSTKRTFAGQARREGQYGIQTKESRLTCMR